MPNQNRQLAAILFTDIVGYTAMMQLNEQNAVAVNKRYVAVLKQFVSLHGGKILNDYGDGSLCTFTSATQAVKCAIDMQRQLQSAPNVPLRIGLHIGEIFFEDGKVYGDGVNIASRIQSLGIGNSILYSSEISSKLKNQQEFKSVSIGQFHFKNVDEPMEVFALANEGLTVPKKEELSGKLKVVQKKVVFQKGITTAIVVLLLTGSYFIYQKYFHINGFTGDDKTIAVLPFENVGLVSSEDFISDGITQDIINRLSKISSLKKVIAWFSVKGFKKTTKSLNGIANELDVAAILSGTIQKQGDITHIVVELIDVDTKKRLWGDKFDYNSNDILSVQSNIAAQIVSALRASITPEEKKNLSKHYTENVEAYKYYLRGRNFWYERSRESFDSAETNFKQAIRLDPNYALAYAGIADCYTFNYKRMSQLEAIPIARGYANQALSLDSNLSEGLTSLGFIQHNFDFEWAKSKKTLERAIDLDPNNPTAHLYYGNLLQFTGNTKEGLREVEKAVEIDPLAFGANWVLGRNYYYAGENEKAIVQFKKTLEIAPKQKEMLFWSLGLAYFENKMYLQARQEFDRISECNNSNPIDYYLIMQSYGYALLGDKAKAKEVLGKALKEEVKVWLSPYRLSEVYITLGDYDAALEQLEKAFETRDLHLFMIKVDPGFSPIRNQQRFKYLLKKMGLE